VQRCLDDYLAGQRYPLELIKDLTVPAALTVSRYIVSSP
jgi:hypothetical protein